MYLSSAEMKFKNLVYAVDGPIATIRLSRVSRRNALNAELKIELTQALRQFQDDGSVASGVLTGEGEVFCAGGDIGEFTELAGKTGPEIVEAARLSAEPHRTGLGLTKPLVAAVNGPALGSGFGLVAFCPFAVAAEHATFGITPIRLGVVPLPVMPAAIRALGYRKALQLCLTAEVIDAHEALRMGLVDQVVPAADVMLRALTVARRLAEQSPMAVRGAMEAFHDLAGRTQDDVFDQVVLRMVPYYQTEDLREGCKAFLEKRAARWTGR